MNKLNDFSSEKKDFDAALEIASRYYVQNELMLLVVHDFAHRILRIESNLSRLEKKLKVAFGNHHLYNPLHETLSDAHSDTENLLSALNQIRRFNYQSEDDASNFELRDVVSQIVNFFGEIFDRYKMTAIIKPGNRVRIHGIKIILEQVIMNIIINAIDAQKSRRKMRHNRITFDISKDETDFTIRISDQGPGIDRSVWRRPDDVFILGTTSKKSGTGAGLSVSRNLLNKYFSGEIYLVDPDNALFHIRCPLR